MLFLWCFLSQTHDNDSCPGKKMKKLRAISEEKKLWLSDRNVFKWINRKTNVPKKGGLNLIEISSIYLCFSMGRTLDHSMFSFW